MHPRVLHDQILTGSAPTIVDVRSPEEYAAGHVPGAVNLPYEQVRAGTIAPPVESGAAIVVYCGHGPRAWMAARGLRKMGYGTIRFMRGHMAGWRRAGLPEERGRRS